MLFRSKQLERDVKKSRTRLERQLRTRRRDAGRILRDNQRAVGRRVDAAKDRVTTLV